MKFRSFLIAALITSVLSMSAFAQEATASNNQVNPDSPLYGLDVAWDKITLLLTFGKAERAGKALEIAKERLAEAKVMSERKNLDAAQRAASENAQLMQIARENIRALSESNSSRELEKSIELEAEADEQGELVGQAETELKVKTRGQLSEDQREKLDALLQSFRNETGRVKLEIREKKGAALLRIKARLGISDNETDELEEKTEVRIREKSANKTGLSEEKDGRVSTEFIRIAENKIEEGQEKIAKAASRGANSTAAQSHLDSARNHLEAAKEAFARSQFAESREHALLARREAVNAEIRSEGRAKVGEVKEEKERNGMDESEENVRKTRLNATGNGTGMGKKENESMEGLGKEKEKSLERKDGELKRNETPVSSELKQGERMIEIASSGFVPETITVGAGTKVKFVNKDVARHWPASAVHPTHSVYPDRGGCIGSTFDACKGLAEGEEFDYTFNHRGSWNYHDHLNPSLRGMVKVE